MRATQGKQVELPFECRQTNSAPERGSRKQKAYRTANGKPHRKMKPKTKRRREPDTVADQVLSKAEVPSRRSRKQKEPLVVFPLRLTISQHKRLKEFASKYRFSMHEYLLKAADDPINRSKNGESIDWLKL
jgi:hypothetical protein